MHKVPPIGLRPRIFAMEDRISEVYAAIQRYVRAGFEVPQEWLDEYAELHEWIFSYRDNNRSG